MRTRVIPLPPTIRAVCVSVAVLIGCGGETNDVADGGAAVYVDRETGQVFTGPQRATPAAHPQTGRATLMPGMHCPRCGRWHPAPPLELLQRMPDGFRCPEDGQPLLREGPVPAEAQPLTPSEAAS